MKVFYNSSLKKSIYRDSVIAIGNFDGIHVGHKKVLQSALKKAKEANKKFGLLTFEPIPVMYFNKKIINHRIDSLSQKLLNLKKEKLDFIIVQKFNKKFSKINYKEFISKILFKKIGCKYIYVSKNFKFGNKREGNVKHLIANEKKYSYRTVVTSAVKQNKKTISSTKIRELIKNGNISQANKLLNRKWEVSGKVIRGSKRGRKIGFPTCNILMKNYVLPKLGVYAVNVKINKILKKELQMSAIDQLLKGKKLLLEVNIFGIKKNLYNKRINVIFNKFIRPEKKFKGILQLKDQIKKDIKLAK